MPEESTNDTQPIFLEDVILALQKSFSRVANITNEYRESLPADAVSMIVSSVDFEISLNAVPVHSEDITHRFIYLPDGPIKMTFKGKIDPDFKDDGDIASIELLNDKLDTTFSIE